MAVKRIMPSSTFVYDNVPAEKAKIVPAKGKVVGCSHCGKTKTTLYKVGEHRYCKKCVPIIKAIEEADEKERSKNAYG